MSGAVGFFDMAEYPSAPVDISFASAAKATYENKVVDMCRRCLAQLQQEAKAAEQKAQASKRALKAEARKRARTKTTMHSYFTSSRNSLNRGPLQCSDVGDVGAGSCRAQLMDTELETSQSIDTEILLSCPVIVLVSDEEEATSNSEEDFDLNTDEMVDSDNDAFADKVVGMVKRGRPTDEDIPLLASTDLEKRSFYRPNGSL